MKSLLVILGNQLFPQRYLAPLMPMPVFMAEDVGLCTHFKYHKHKLILFLGAMRAYAARLRQAGVAVDYHALDEQTEDQPYEFKLLAAVSRAKADEIVSFEIEDKFFEARLEQFCQANGLVHRTVPSPMFLTPRPAFADYLHHANGKPFMRTFYQWQRKHLNLLMDDRGKPVGGQFSFDEDNRKPLPKTVNPPEPTYPKRGPGLDAVIALVNRRFADHPGDGGAFWLPVTRPAALAWLKEFLNDRLALFGPYEDAIPARSTFVYHSVLSPVINLGLITPEEVVTAAVDAATKQGVPLSSLEGFVRQVIGWREFIRGVYQNFSEKQEAANFWKHTGRLSPMWYRGDSGIPPLDHTIAKANKLGWCHHIERLMVVMNLMTLCGIHPAEIYRWFMEMFVDSSDWVMGPNVWGMGFGDGGIYTTKPYLCGSNYLMKMSGERRGDWCDDVDGLYWSFISRNRSVFEGNMRSRYIPLTLDRMDVDRQKRLFARAEAFRARASVLR